MGAGATQHATGCNEVRSVRLRVLVTRRRKMRGTETGGPGGKVGLVRVPSTSEGPTAALAGPEHSEKIPSDPV
ncbi:hypothetical protein ACKVWC_003711 [Pyricularia oryzae]